jgi:hypothetical protein
MDKCDRRPASSRATSADDRGGENVALITGGEVNCIVAARQDNRFVP